MDKNKVLDFVKSHKKEIAVTATVIGGAVLVAIGCNRTKSGGSDFVKRSIEDIDIPDWSIGTLTDSWYEKDHICAIVDYFTVADMGAVVKEFMDKLGVDPKANVSAIIGIYDKKDK